MGEDTKRAQIAADALAWAAAAALVAGTAVALGLAAAHDAWLHHGSAVLVALAAVWLPQALVVTYITARSRRR